MTEQLAISIKNKLTLVQVTTVPITLYMFFSGQIAFLSRRGFEFIGVSSPGAELDEFSRTEGVPVHAVPMTRGISPAADLISLIRLWRLFRRIQPDIVHGSTAKAGLLSMVAATLAGVPIRVYTLHGLMIEIREGVARKLLKGMEWIACHCAGQVLAVSRSVADTVVSEGLCPSHKIKILANGSANGVDAEKKYNPKRIDEADRNLYRQELNLGSGAIVIGYVGRLVRDKGIVELASAWTRLRNQSEDTYLLMIGPPESHNPVPPDVLNGLRQDLRVRMIDFVPKEEMPHYYAIMDMVVLPTYREGLPTVVLEASAMGLPVVASEVTGCVDAVLDGVTGTLVAPRDIESLTTAVHTYLENPELRQTHGRAGRERMLREFKPVLIWEALYEEYTCQLQKKGLAVPAFGTGWRTTADSQSAAGRQP
ncbi:MAG: glycosyltransferase family 4 protein [Desulfomonilaceae bacterium]